MPIKVFKNVLTGASTVLTLDPGPVPTVSQTREKLRAARFSLKRRPKVGVVKLTKSAVRLGVGYADRVAAQTVVGVERMIDAHPKGELVRKKIGPLQLLVFRSKSGRSDAVTSG
jgi:hypothetical protein